MTRRKTAPVVADDDAPALGPPAPAPAPEFVFTGTFAESTRGLAVDRFRQQCLAKVRDAGYKPVRQVETQDPPLGTAAPEGLRAWTIRVEVA
jgi:hypothetical protein